MRQIRCPNCNKRILDADLILNGQIKCPRCGEVFSIDDIDFLIERVKIIFKYLTKKNK